MVFVRATDDVKLQRREKRGFQKKKLTKKGENVREKSGRLLKGVLTKQGEVGESGKNQN